MAEQLLKAKPLIVAPKHKTEWLNLLDGLNRLSVALLLPISIFILWWLAANLGWMPEQILPSPEVTWQSFQSLAATDLWWQLGVSLQRLIMGVVLGVVAGVLLGVLLGNSKQADQYISPTFFALAIIPTLAWLPLLMLWIGIENALKVFIIFKATLIPITLQVQTGVRCIAPQLKEMAAILQLSKPILFYRLLLPATLPYFMTGLRLALAAAWTSLIAVELLASSEGIGYLMVMGRQLFQLDMVFVCIVLIASVGIVFDLLLQLAERKWVFWPHTVLAVHGLSQRKRHSWLKAWAIPMILLLLWFIGTSKLAVVELSLASPIQVIQALSHGIADGSLPTAMYHSLYRALLGLLIGGSIGVITGLVLGLVKALEDIFAPTLNTLRLIVIFAWIPLITAWFGLGDLSKTVFISLATFFPMFISTWKGMRNVPIQLHEVSQVLHLNVWQRLEILIVPSISPAVFSGFRLALLYAWMASFGAEYLMGSGIGIGSYMMAAQQHFEMDRVIAATVLVAALGAILAWLGKKAEDSATAWRNHHG